MGRTLKAPRFLRAFVPLCGIFGTNAVVCKPCEGRGDQVTGKK